MMAGECETNPADAEQRRSHDPESETGGPPRGIGDLSARVGCDVRDLILAGYALEEIHEVAQGRCTLEELLQRRPRNRKKKGRWITNSGE
jgi:hypothetical protein